MAQLVTIDSFLSAKGDLRVIEKLFNNGVKRVYYIENTPLGIVRGKHSHVKTKQVLCCVKGSCEVFVENMNETDEIYSLTSNTNKVLFLEPTDWHAMYNFSSDCILLVLADTIYTPSDYVFKPQKETTIVKFGLID